MAAARKNATILEAIIAMRMGAETESSSDETCGGALADCETVASLPLASRRASRMLVAGMGEVSKRTCNGGQLREDRVFSS